MTTSRITIRREGVHDWPAFNTVSGISVDIGVVSTEVRRRPDESIVAAATAGAVLLQSALEQLPASGLPKLWLVALGRPTLRSNRVAAYNASRNKLWLSLEKSGVELPSGNRVEIAISPSGELLSFGGLIEFPMAELPRALEVTRRTDAICVGSTSRAEDLNWASFVRELKKLEQPSELLWAGLHLTEEGSFIARSFGHFDDAVAGAEIFARSEVLNPLEVVTERLVK